MKKKNLLFLFIFMLLVMPLSVFASDVYNIDMNVYLDRYGNATVTEVWDVKATDGTEWYKVIKDFGESKVSNFKVMMDGKSLTYKEWDTSETLSEKAGYYGINNISGGVELCFGKSDYKRHKFTLTYNLSNLIFNTDNEQVLYNMFISKMSGVNFSGYSIKIQGYSQFSDTLDVWGYGNKGYTYLENGVIYSSNDGYSIDKDVVILVKFPSGTFNTSQRIDGYDTFDDVLKAANSGSFQYNYTSFTQILAMILNFIVYVIGPIVVIILSVIMLKNKGYGYKDNKVINKKNTPMFRDIPCNKDIYYANALISLNDFGYKDTNILGAILLKWIKQNKIGFKTETKGMFKKESTIIDLTMNPTFDNESEKRLFDMMYEASKDGILESNELEKWCRSNYEEFLSLFKGLLNNKVRELKQQGYIYNRKNRAECKKKMIMDDRIYNDSMQLYGLKLYLEEFAKMNTKEAMEVHLWDEYLMFAYLFGIADKVMKQFKNLYPEVVELMEQSNVNLDTLVFVNNISMRSISAAGTAKSAARRAAESYHGGGGGFNIGGGGGGSFGGGGGGSR